MLCTGQLAGNNLGIFHLDAIVLRPDGSAAIRSQSSAGSAEEAAREVAERLLSAGAGRILAELR